MIHHALIEFSPWKWKEKRIKMIHLNDCNHWRCNCFCNALLRFISLANWLSGQCPLECGECNRMKQMIGVVLCSTPNRWMSISSVAMLPIFCQLVTELDWYDEIGLANAHINIHQPKLGDQRKSTKPFLFFFIQLICHFSLYSERYPSELKLAPFASKFLLGSIFSSFCFRFFRILNSYPNNGDLSLASLAPAVLFFGRISREEVFSSQWSKLICFNE